MRPRILPAGEIVVEEGAGGHHERVKNHHCHPAAIGSARADGANHQTDYGTIARMIPLRDVIPSRTFPFIKKREEEGLLSLHGLHFDLASGTLLALDDDRGSFTDLHAA